MAHYTRAPSKPTALTWLIGRLTEALSRPAETCMTPGFVVAESQEGVTDYSSSKGLVLYNCGRGGDAAIYSDCTM